MGLRLLRQRWSCELQVMRNWYNQLLLTRYLKQRHIDVLGTLNRRRQHVPDIIKDASERLMHIGQRVSCHCGDIAVTTWKDVKLVTVLSTYHSDHIEAAEPGRNGTSRSRFSTITSAWVALISKIKAPCIHVLVREETGPQVVYKILEGC